MSEFYIRNKHQAFLGNSPVWWAKEGKGYTAYIQGAERFSEQEAKDLVSSEPSKYESFKCSEIDKRLHLVFDWQDIKRIGTDDPCGWSFGYAPQSKGNE